MDEPTSKLIRYIDKKDKESQSYMEQATRCMLQKSKALTKYLNDQRESQGGLL